MTQKADIEKKIADLLESDLSFPDMIRARTRGWRESYDANYRPLLADAVTLTHRKRGDYFGYLHQTRARTQWRKIFGKTLVTYPVVERSIRSKTATSVSTRIKIAIEPVRRLPEKEAAAELGDAIYKFVDTHLWTNKTEMQIAEHCQTGRFCFAFNNYAASGGLKVDIPITKKKPIKTGFTEYACTVCGAEYFPEELGISDPAEDVQNPKPKSQSPNDSIDADLPECPDCGGALSLTSLAKIELINSLTGESVKKETGFPEMRIVSPLLTRIDTYNTTGFDYKRAHWFNFHPLIPLYQLLKIAPQLKDKVRNSNFSRWSESARWHYELANMTESGGTPYSKTNSYFLDELVEVDFWWITPQACFGWISPENYECEGFTIKKGETIEQACVRQFAAFEGLLVATVDDEVIPIGTQNFAECFVGFPWKIDAMSFFPQGEENLLAPQDAVTRLLSMVNAHCGRFGNPKLIVNALRFGNSSDFEKNFAGQVVYTDATDIENANSDYRRDIGWLQPADLSPAVYNFIQLIIDIAKEISGVFNETVGNVETTDETLGGRELALNQSLGLMTPTQQAKATGIVEWVYCWLKLVQRYAPDEAFTLFKGTFDEEWKTDDIRSFRELDIDNELFVRVVHGTDIPKTESEMEAKFVAAMNFGLFIEPNPLPVEVRNHILTKVLGIEYDISNYTATKRIASRRLDVIKEELEMFAVEDAITVETDQNGFPMRSLQPAIIASMMQDPRTAVRESDDHLSMIGFWRDQLNGMIGAREQNELHIFAAELMIKTHQTFIAALTAQAQAAQGVADNAPAQIAQTQDNLSQPQEQPAAIAA